MKTVNLNEIFEGKAFYNNCLYDLTENEKQCVIDIMREACEQTVELCAENPKLKGYTYSHGIERNIVDLGEEVCVDDKYTNYISTDKQSILNTKNQIV